MAAVININMPIKVGCQLAIGAGSLPYITYDIQQLVILKRNYWNIILTTRNTFLSLKHNRRNLPSASSHLYNLYICVCVCDFILQYFN